MEDDHKGPMEYPAWRAAISQLMREKRLEPGTLFTKEELYGMFYIEMTSYEMPHGKARKLELQFLNQFKEFERTLLEEHQIALQNQPGVGYFIVRPQDQSDWAERHGHHEVRKAIHRLTNRLTNVNLVQLKADERRANADALARVGMLNGMFKQSTEFKLTPPPKPKPPDEPDDPVDA